MRAAGRKLRAEGRVHTKRVPQAENGVPKAAYTQKTRAAGQKQRAEGRTSFYSRKKRAAGWKLHAKGRVYKKLGGYKGTFRRGAYMHSG